MGEVGAPRYLAGLVYPRVVEKPALVPSAFKWVGGLPHVYLAVKLESHYTYLLI